MKPRVLALDFDGTIAANDTLDSGASAAIQDARVPGCWPFSSPVEC
jgi:hypothetical protein